MKPGAVQWDRFDILRHDDVDGFATALVSDPAATHRLAEAALAPAVDRYHTLDDDTQEQFRTALDRFVRLYGFLSLVVTFTDLDLEKTHLYGKALLRHTVGPRPDRIDVGDKVALTHLRMDTTFQGSASVEEAAHETAQVWSGRGPLSDEAQEALSVIVKEMNDRFGETLTEEDRLVLDQYQGAFVTNEAVAQAARTNDFDKFREVVFEPQFLTTIINQMDANEKIFKRILSDEQMRTLFAEYLARTVYDDVRQDS